jgi:hypothetical protein
MKFSILIPGYELEIVGFDGKESGFVSTRVHLEGLSSMTSRGR